MKGLSYNINHFSRFLRKHTLLCIVGLFVFLSLGTNQAVQWRIQHTYKTMISNREFLDAFTKDDDKNVATLAASMGFSYMRFSKEKVIYKSDPTFPTPRLVTFLQHPLASVLEEKLEDRLSHMKPYVSVIDYTLYIIFPIELATKPQEGYLIYRRVF